MSQNRSTAVMARRHEAADSLDFFPTPPWATRALCDWLGNRLAFQRSVWEPASGEGHMSDVLMEYFAFGKASDVHDYNRNAEIGSFVGQGPDVIQWDGVRPPDWIITNPPFNLALEFAERAIREVHIGVALLVRLAWLEGGSRYARLFKQTPPWKVALFSERVPMTKGRWDPMASTATAYCWVCWNRRAFVAEGQTYFQWIPPGQRQRLSKPDDVQRFAGSDA